MPYLNRVFVDHRLQIHQGMSQKIPTFKFSIFLRYQRKMNATLMNQHPPPVQASPVLG